MKDYRKEKEKKKGRSGKTKESIMREDASRRKRQERTTVQEIVAEIVQEKYGRGRGKKR